MVPTRSSAGVTLFESLASIAILGALMAVLLPAVSASRESSRRSVCGANLHQLGIALSSYHAQLGTLPCAVIWSPSGEPLGQGILPIGVIDRVARYGELDQDTLYANWLVALLPMLGEQAMLARFDSTQPISHEANRTVRLAELSVLKCPSDGASQAGRVYLRGLAAGLGDNAYARGNYAINVGPDAYCLVGQAIEGTTCVSGFTALGTDLLHDNRAVWGSGIAGANKSFSFAHVTDGLSSTVAVDEIRAGSSPFDLRGAWALGQIGASVLARHGRYTVSGSPNPEFVLDRIIGCGKLVRDSGAAALHQARMPCLPEPLSQEVNTLSASRSEHPGGVQVLFLDGSARWLADSIDIDIWHGLHTRSGGEP